MSRESMYVEPDERLFKINQLKKLHLCLLILFCKEFILPNPTKIHNQPWAELPCLTKGYAKENSIETATSFQLELSNHFLPLLDNLPNEVEEFSNAIYNHIIKTAEKITPPVREPLPNWMQTDTMTAINNKKAIRQKYGDSSIQYKVAKAETKKTS